MYQFLLFFYPGNWNIIRVLKLKKVTKEGKTITYPHYWWALSDDLLPFVWCHIFFSSDQDLWCHKGKRLLYVWRHCIRWWFDRYFSIVLRWYPVKPFYNLHFQCFKNTKKIKIKYKWTIYCKPCWVSPSCIKILIIKNKNITGRNR